MPIWFELIVLMLVAYGVGVLAGWLIWNEAADPDADDHANQGDEN